MKKYKSTLIAVAVFVCIFGLVLILYNTIFKTEFVCTDVTNNTKYKFDTKEEMDAFCDNLSTIDDSSMTTFPIYDDLINNNDSRFSFYPYIDSDNQFTITVVIVDCLNPNDAKNQSINWFRNHGYDINDYNIEYEYPCE